MPPVPLELINALKDVRIIYAAGLDGKLVDVAPPDDGEHVTLDVAGQAIEVNCKITPKGGQQQAIYAFHKLLKDKGDVVKVDDKKATKVNISLKKALSGTHVDIKYILLYTQGGADHRLVLRGKHDLAG